MTTNLQCTLQNRLGALDRLLAALTHRGIVPRQIVSACTDDNRVLEVALSFELPEENTKNDKAVEKLVKALQKQVFVLNVSLVEQLLPKPLRAVKVPLLLQPHLNKRFTQSNPRRVSHANNA